MTRDMSGVIEHVHKVTEERWEAAPAWLRVLGKPFYRRKVWSARSPSAYAYEYSDQLPPGTS